MTPPTRDLMGTKKRKYEEEEDDNEIEKEVANLRLEAKALRKKKRIHEEVRGENLSSGLQAVEKKEALRLELTRLEREEEQEKANLALLESKSQEDSAASIDALEAYADMKELKRKIDIIEKEKLKLKEMRSTAEEKYYKAIKEGQQFEELRRNRTNASKQKISQVQEKIRSVRKDLAIAEGGEEKVVDLEQFIDRQIQDLEAELSCPICFEVARNSPIFKCSDDHLICRYSKLMRTRSYSLLSVNVGQN